MLLDFALPARGAAGEAEQHDGTHKLRGHGSGRGLSCKPMSLSIYGSIECTSHMIDTKFSRDRTRIQLLVYIQHLEYN